MNDETPTPVTDDDVDADVAALNEESVEKDCETEDGSPLASSQREFRLARILDGLDEGLDYDDIGLHLGISGKSVRNIVNKHRAKENQAEPVLESSLTRSLTNHSPDEDQLLAIKEIRLAADALALKLDRIRVNPREVAIAKTKLEECTMWAVKAVVLPLPEEG